MRKRSATPTSFTVCVFFLLPAVLIAKQPSDFPGDVKQFIEKRDLCDHFRGEPHYSVERSRFLERQIEKYCTGTNLELLSLKTRYRNNSAVMGKLSTYEENVEACD